MSERLHFSHGVDFLVEWDDKHEEGCVYAVVYDRLESAQIAADLAASMRVPVGPAHAPPAQAPGG